MTHEQIAYSNGSWNIRSAFEQQTIELVLRRVVIRPERQRRLIRVRGTGCIGLLFQKSPQVVLEYKRFRIVNGQRQRPEQRDGILLAPRAGREHRAAIHRCRLSP